MAFDDISLSERDLIFKLLEAHTSGKYSPEFFVTADGEDWSIKLEGINGNEPKELRDFTESDLLMLETKRYLTPNPQIGEDVLSLAPKAFEHFHLSQAAATLRSSGVQKPAHADVRNKENTIDIFISHSSQDEKLAKELAEFLNIVFKTEKIRCTSVTGYKLEPGATVEETLRKEIHESKVFIGLITPASLSSHYVLFELGARWGAQLDLIPVLASGADSSDLREPLKNRNPVRCDMRAEIRDLVAKIAALLGIEPYHVAVHEKLVDALIKKAKVGKERKQKQKGAMQSAPDDLTKHESETRNGKRIRTLLSQEISHNVKYLREVHDQVKAEEAKHAETIKTDEHGQWSSEGDPYRALRRLQPDALSKTAWETQMDQATSALTQEEIASIFSFYGGINGIAKAQERFINYRGQYADGLFDEVMRLIEETLSNPPRLS